MCYPFKGLDTTDKFYRKYSIILTCAAAINLFPVQKRRRLAGTYEWTFQFLTLILMLSLPRIKNAFDDPLTPASVVPKSPFHPTATRLLRPEAQKPQPKQILFLFLFISKTSLEPPHPTPTPRSILEHFWIFNPIQPMGLLVLEPKKALKMIFNAFYGSSTSPMG